MIVCVFSLFSFFASAPPSGCVAHAWDCEATCEVFTSAPGERVECIERRNFVNCKLIAADGFTIDQIHETCSVGVFCTEECFWLFGALCSILALCLAML